MPFPSGAALLLTRPFAKGDRLLVGGTEGTVQDVGVMFTSLRTTEGGVMRVPSYQVS